MLVLTGFCAGSSTGFFTSFSVHCKTTPPARSLRGHSWRYLKHTLTTVPFPWLVVAALKLYPNHCRFFWPLLGTSVDRREWSFGDASIDASIPAYHLKDRSTMCPSRLCHPCQICAGQSTSWLMICESREH